MRLKTFCLLAALLCLSACATSPTGRRQLHLVSLEDAAKIGDQSFTQIKKQTPVDRVPADNAYAVCIVRALAGATGQPNGGGKWDVTVFKQDKTVNAFAGRARVGVHRHLLGGQDPGRAGGGAGP